MIKHCIRFLSEDLIIDSKICKKLDCVRSAPLKGFKHSTMESLWRFSIFLHSQIGETPKAWMHNGRPLSTHWFYRSNDIGIRCTFWYGHKMSWNSCEFYDFFFVFLLLYTLHECNVPRSGLNTIKDLFEPRLVCRLVKYKRKTTTISYQELPSCVSNFVESTVCDLFQEFDSVGR